MTAVIHRAEVRRVMDHPLTRIVYGLLDRDDIARLDIDQMRFLLQRMRDWKSLNVWETRGEIPGDLPRVMLVVIGAIPDQPVVLRESVDGVLARWRRWKPKRPIPGDEFLEMLNHPVLLAARVIEEPDESDTVFLDTLDCPAVEEWVTQLKSLKERLDLQHAAEMAWVEVWKARFGPQS
jgi:hypothetical protein